MPHHPVPDYDPALPITARREDILAAIRDHQVVIIAGETGSGKSTQLPKLCLEAGRGAEGLIGCTQPRRIAARSVARRVAEELNISLGGLVGYQVRFAAKQTADTRIKFMTDGILLAEIHGDRRLKRYDTLIIDEAHERSLNVDFLLGYLKRLLPSRPDLKVIVTSATIDTEKFSRHFNDAPVITVSGRGHPVDVEYQPLEEADGDMNLGVGRAVDRLTRIDPRGDVLVFLPGEADIFAAARYLRKRNLLHTEVLPLYARLPAQAQDRVFKPGALRRLVLATNVAETSLTVPGIRFVIDSGLARISRYASHSKVLRLPVEPVSQASCDQRKGRCGRIGPGTCIRLYSEEDYLSRPEFTEPEILRTPLASTVLGLLGMRLGDPEDFPFVDPPRSNMLKEAWQTLFELGAVDRDKRITRTGKQLVRLPVDVRHGRMLLEAAERGALNEALVLVAALGIQDPRERPADQQQAADQAHAEFLDPDSDFLSLLNLWRWWHKTLAAHSRNQAEKRARRHFLSPGRLREWRNLHDQLWQLVKSEKWKVNRKPAEAPAIHRSLLAGLIAHAGQHQEAGDYQGARGHKFRIFSGSTLAKRQPAWIMAGELIETSRPYARMVAPLKAEWLEQQAGHLLRHRHFDPHWDRRSGRVMGFEQVTLFGLTLVEKRRVHYGAHDPETARTLFIRHALVRGEMNRRDAFLKRNRALRDELAEHEHKRRKRDVLAAETRLVEFFDRVLPADVYTVKAFARWFESLDEDARGQLLYDRATLLREDAEEAGAEFPDRIEIGGESFRLEYRFEPGHPADGVTLICPMHLLNRLDAASLAWLVPGLVEEKVTGLIGTLPKSLRRSLVPAKDYARAALERCRRGLWPRPGAAPDSSGPEAPPTGGPPLTQALAEALSKISGMDIPAGQLDESRLPDHLRMNIRVLAPNGNVSGGVAGEGRDLDALQEQFGRKARRLFMDRQGGEFQRDGLTGWDFGVRTADLRPSASCSRQTALGLRSVLPETATTPGGHRAWPAVTDQNDAAGLRLFDDRAEAVAAHRAGLACLLRLQLKDKFKYLEKNTGLRREDCLAWSVLGSCAELAADLRAAVLDARLDDAWSIRDAEAFEARVSTLRAALVDDYTRLAKLVGGFLRQWREVRVEAAECADRYPEAATDIESQFEDLIYAGFVRDVPASRLASYPRYIEAVSVRLRRLEENPGRDAQRQAQVDPWWQRYLSHLEEFGWYSETVDAYRWLLEEFRVQCFAQELGTQGKVSAKRLEEAWGAVERERGG